MNFLTQLLPTGRAGQGQKRRSRRGRGGGVKGGAEIATMRQAAYILATGLEEIAAQAEPGLSTAGLDAYAEDRIRGPGGTPRFKG